MERTIKVTGKGKISVKPDLIRLVMSLEGIRESYEDALQFSATETECLKDMFEKLEFQRSDLKTLSFNINTEYENYQDRDKRWKRRFVGYKFHHSLKVEFNADNALLGKVLYTLAHGAVTPEFRIIYTVKNMEAAKNELLAEAVQDSRAKAEKLSVAAGVTLGEVILIDYSWGEIEIVSSPMDRMLAPQMVMEDSSCSYNIDIEPDDIDVQDTVTVVWRIA